MKSVQQVVDLVLENAPQNLSKMLAEPKEWLCWSCEEFNTEPDTICTACGEERLLGKTSSERHAEYKKLNRKELINLLVTMSGMLDHNSERAHINFHRRIVSYCKILSL